MADNSVTVEIKDGVASSIPTKIDRIAASARTAHTAVEKLQLQQQRLATETARTATQQQRLQTESAKTATQQARLSTETQRTTTQTQRLATAAQSNAATAAIRQQQVQARLDQTLNGSSRAASNASGSLALLAKQYLSLAAAAVAAKQALDLATTYTQAFIRFDRPMAQMGKSQEETLRLITTINKELANGPIYRSVGHTLFQDSKGKYFFKSLFKAAQNITARNKTHVTADAKEIYAFEPDSHFAQDYNYSEEHQAYHWRNN